MEPSNTHRKTLSPGAAAPVVIYTRGGETQTQQNGKNKIMGMGVFRGQGWAFIEGSLKWELYSGKNESEGQKSFFFW